MRYSESIRSIYSRPLAGSWARPGVGVALGVLAAAMQLPMVKDVPVNWDAVQYALAIGKFDLHHHQPHPPGYILYVALGRAANVLVNDPALSLALLSVLFSAAAVALVYWLGLMVFEDSAVALGASLLLVCSPLALYYGSVGLTYVPEMAFSILVAGLAWRLRSTRSVSDAALLGLTLGLLGGIRQTGLVVLLPLCAWALWKQERRTIAAFVATLAGVCIAWLVPLLLLSGGPSAYLHESALLAATASKDTSVARAGLGALFENVSFEVLALGLGLAFAAIPLGIWALRLVRFSMARNVKLFLAWWALPPLLLYSVSHVGQYGYMLVILPALVLPAALAVRVIAHRLKEHAAETQAAVAICGILALASGAYFALAQGPITAHSISQNDAYWRSVRSELARFDPSDTVLVSAVKWESPFRQAGYLLPGYHLFGQGKDRDEQIGWMYSAYGGRSDYALPHPPAQATISLPQGVHNVIALDEETGRMLAAGSGQVSRVSLAGGFSLYVIRSSNGISQLRIHAGAITAH